MNMEKDLAKVMVDDGVNNVNVEEFENRAITSIKEIEKKMGNAPWAVRVAYNERFGGVLIAQQPGCGNRLHYHPDADEFWFIIKGEWEWFIEGEGVRKARKNDIVLARKNKKHRMKVIGKETGIRLAITKPDVEHIFVE